MLLILADINFESQLATVFGSVLATSATCFIVYEKRENVWLSFFFSDHWKGMRFTESPSFVFSWELKSDSTEQNHVLTVLLRGNHTFRHAHFCLALALSHTRPFHFWETQNQKHRMSLMNQLIWNMQWGNDESKSKTPATVTRARWTRGDVLPMGREFNSVSRISKECTKSRCEPGVATVGLAGLIISCSFSFCICA